MEAEASTDRSQIKNFKRANVVAGLATIAGFEDMGACAADCLDPNDAVREVCNQGLCPSYGHCWTCPPAIGTLDHFRRLFGGYAECLVFETVAPYDMDDKYFVQKLLDKHVRRSMRLINMTKPIFPNALFLLAKPCEHCVDCAYPDEPCRYKDVLYPTMEGAGLMVSYVCEDAHVPFNHKHGTITLVSCVLL